MMNDEYMKQKSTKMESDGPKPNSKMHMSEKGDGLAKVSLHGTRAPGMPKLGKMHRC